MTNSRDAPLDGWLDAVTAAGGRAAEVAATGRALLRRWAEPHRRYHTVEHLTAMLSIVDSLAAGAPDPDAVRLATWFHDAVYDPRRPDNEDASARLAETTLGELGVPPATVAEVARLVRLTATHDPASDDRDGALLCDADLAILAAPPPAYRRYADEVRAEYAHLDDAVFRAGRAAVLRALLDRPAIFRLPNVRDKWEISARMNLANEILTLTEAPSNRKPLDS